MSENPIPFQPSPPVRPDAAIYGGPDDVVGDAKLTTAEKRAILASWVSDSRAVENAPTLRRLEGGGVVEVETILRSLAALDPTTHAPANGSKLIPFVRRRRGAMPKWSSRVGPPGGFDDDDDPPPAPAGFGVPFRPTFIAADAAGGRLAAGGAGA